MSPETAWNGSGLRFAQLEEALHREMGEFVESVECYPGGALDSMRIELRQSSGTVPRELIELIHEHDLEIRSVGGYKSIQVSRTERFGGSLREELEIDRESDNLQRVTTSPTGGDQT